MTQCTYIVVIRALLQPVSYDFNTNGKDHNTTLQASLFVDK